MTTQSQNSLSREERLEIQLRNEKIKRVEDYVTYQSELNYWKRQCQSLEEKLDDQDTIHDGTADILDQHCSYHKDDLMRLRSELEAKAAELDEEDELLTISTNIIATICDKLAKIFASYNFAATI